MNSFDAVDWDAIDVPESARRSWNSAMGYFYSTTMYRLWAYQDLPVQDEICSRYYEMYCLFNSPITSPIEQMLSGWLVWISSGTPLGLPSCGNGPKSDLDYEFQAGEEAFELSTQTKIGSHRVDFMFTMSGPKGVRRLVIECDGHDFHDKTKEQAARDKKRDRDILLAGCQVMRFTGSEIWKDCYACAEQIEMAVQSCAMEVI